MRISFGLVSIQLLFFQVKRWTYRNFIVESRTFDIFYGVLQDWCLAYETLIFIVHFVSWSFTLFWNSMFLLVFENVILMLSLLLFVLIQWVNINSLLGNIFCCVPGNLPYSENGIRSHDQVYILTTYYLYTLLRLFSFIMFEFWCQCLEKCDWIKNQWLC